MALDSPQFPEQVIAGCNTPAKLFLKRINELGDKIALREKDFGIWNEYTWSEYGEQARLCGLGLKALGLNPGDVCSIASEVNKEWLFADFGIICTGGITNGVYPTDAADQVEYLINDSDTRFYFVEDEEQLDKVLEVRERTPTLEKIIIFDMEGLRHFDDAMCMSFKELSNLGREYEKTNPDVWVAEINRTAPEDILTLTYTSGTTGRPKGAMISHRNMMFMMSTLQNIYGIRKDDNQLAFLPLAHVAGRMFYAFSPLESQCVVNLVESMETVNQDQQEVAPTIHFAVPRVWEKMFSTVAMKLKDATKPGRWAHSWALRTGERASAFRKKGVSPPPFLRFLNFVADKTVLRNIRIMLGINNARWLSTAAAPIAPDLIDWFWSLGRPMYEVYGQTESCGLATANMPALNKSESRQLDADRPLSVRVGSIGKAANGSKVKLSDQGEILIQNPGVIQGYWKLPEKTAETIRDGWLYTGDVGSIDDDGFLFIHDRMKDIIITAGGKNITPSEIENQLKFSQYISDAVVIGDQRPYLTCLVMIDEENVMKFAQDHNVPFTNYTSLCHTREINDLIWSEVETVNSKFARVESIKKVRLIDQLLDAEDEELTPTMKLKRKVVNEKYSDLIESMY